MDAILDTLRAAKYASRLAHGIVGGYGCRIVHTTGHVCVDIIVYNWSPAEGRPQNSQAASPPNTALFYDTIPEPFLLPTHNQLPEWQTFAYAQERA